jgi:hypothetical protein
MIRITIHDHDDLIELFNMIIELDEALERFRESE